MTTRAIVRPVVRSIPRSITGGITSSVLGPELLANGEFDSDTVWTKGTGWVIAAGEAVVTTPGATSRLTQPVAFVTGGQYTMTIVITSQAAGGIFVRGYTGAVSTFNFGGAIAAPGTYTRTVTASGSPDTFSIDGSAAAIASIASVSLKRIFA